MQWCIQMVCTATWEVEAGGLLEGENTETNNRTRT